DLGGHSWLPRVSYVEAFSSPLMRGFITPNPSCVQKAFHRAENRPAGGPAARLCMQFELGFALRVPCSDPPGLYQPGAPCRNRSGHGRVLNRVIDMGEGKREKGETCFRNLRVFPSPF